MWGRAWSPSPSSGMRLTLGCWGCIARGILDRLLLLLLLLLMLTIAATLTPTSNAWYNP